MDSKPPIDLIATALRRERERAGLTLTEVAARAGIAKSTLSQLESGTGNPSLETLWAICTVLGIQFSQILDPPKPHTTVIRYGEGGLTVTAADANYQATLLSACPPGARRDMYLIDAEPGKPRIAAPHPSGTVEHVLISSGRALVGLTGSPVELGPGDYARYPGDAPHIFEALNPGTRAVLLGEYT
jgi:transcriptional regulator with XRE-family HTH domain